MFGALAAALSPEGPRHRGGPLARTFQIKSLTEETDTFNDKQSHNNDQVAALAAAVTQIQQALAKQQLNTDIAAQAASSLPSDATTDPGHPSAADDLKEFQRLPQS